MAAILPPSSIALPRPNTLGLPQARMPQAFASQGLLMRAWDIWLGLILGRFMVFTGVVFYLLGTSRVSDATLGRQWFVGMMLLLAITTPAAFLGRYLLDQAAARRGRTQVSLAGSLWLWMYLEAIWLLCMAGTIHAVELTPLLPAVISLVMLLTVFPSTSSKAPTHGHAAGATSPKPQTASAPTSKWCKKDQCLCGSQSPCASQTSYIPLGTRGQASADGR